MTHLSWRSLAFTAQKIALLGLLSCHCLCLRKHKKIVVYTGRNGKKYEFFIWERERSTNLLSCARTQIEIFRLGIWLTKVQATCPKIQPFRSRRRVKVVWATRRRVRKQKIENIEKSEVGNWNSKKKSLLYFHSTNGAGLVECFVFSNLFVCRANVLPLPQYRKLSKRYQDARAAHEVKCLKWKSIPI